MAAAQLSSTAGYTGGQSYPNILQDRPWITGQWNQTSDADESCPEDTLCTACRLLTWNPTAQHMYTGHLTSHQ